MNAMIRTADEPVPAPIDGYFLANMPMMLSLVTDYGDIDLTFKPSGRAEALMGGTQMRSLLKSQMASQFASQL
jgi:hypothetical protein